MFKQDNQFKPDKRLDKYLQDQVDLELLLTIFVQLKRNLVKFLIDLQIKVFGKKQHNLRIKIIFQFFLILNYIQEYKNQDCKLGHH